MRTRKKISFQVKEEWFRSTIYNTMLRKLLKIIYSIMVLLPRPSWPRALIKFLALFDNISRSIPQFRYYINVYIKAETSCLVMISNKIENRFPKTSSRFPVNNFDILGHLWDFGSDYAASKAIH